MRHLLDALKCMIGLLLRAAGGFVEWARPTAKKAARAAGGALRWITAVAFGAHGERARWSLKLLLAPTIRLAASEHAPEPGKARRLFQLLGWRLHGGGSRGEAHVKAA